MRWLPTRVVEPPAGTLAYADVRAYLRFTSEPEDQDEPLIRSIAAAIPAAFEASMNRAVFRQTREAVALLARGDVVNGVDLEPHTADDEGAADDRLTITLNGGDLRTRSEVVSYGSSVVIRPAVQATGDEEIRFRYKAGWTEANLPPDLKDAMLYEAMRRFVRRNEAVNQSETVPMPKAPSVAHYVVWPDPVRRTFRTVNLGAA